MYRYHHRTLDFLRVRALPTACIACISLLLPFRMQFLMRQTLKKSGVYEKKGME